jgi:hypothetical protein
MGYCIKSVTIKNVNVLQYWFLVAVADGTLSLEHASLSSANKKKGFFQG